MFKFLNINKTNSIPAVLILETDGPLSKKPMFSTDLEKEYIKMVALVGCTTALSYKYSDGAIWGNKLVCPSQGQEIMAYYYKECTKSHKKPYLFCSNWEKYKRALDAIQRRFIEEHFVIHDLNWLHSESQRQIT